MHKTRLDIGTLAGVVVAFATVVGVTGTLIQAWTSWKADQREESKQLGQQTPLTSVPSSSPSPASAATPNFPIGVILASEVGADYVQLRNLLVAQKYKEADQETNRMMLWIANQEKEGQLSAKAMDSFPCQDLRTIDQLWVQNSNGRFGFSVQKEIHNQVGKDWRKLYDQLGWLVSDPAYDKYKNYDELIFEMRAPRGHLPGILDMVTGRRLGGWGRFLDRVETCKI